MNMSDKYNKKRMWKTIAAISVAVLFTAGCSTSSDEGLYNYDLSEYLELGQYKGIEVPEFDTEVTERDVMIELVGTLDEAGEYDELTAGTVQEWDIANIDFSGSKDGVPFEGGTDEGYELTIGSGQFVPGFEEGLTGKNIGDTTIVELTFPENYAPELAGQDVEFTVKINSVKRTELTQEFVEANSEYKTIDEYMDSIRSGLKASNETNAASTRERYLMEAMVDNSNITGYPEKEITAYLDEYTEYYRNLAKQNGLTWKDFLEVNMQATQEEYDARLLENAHMQIGFEMVLCAIAREEGLIEEDGYEAGKLGYLNEMGFESEQAYKDANDGKSFEDDYGKARIEMSLIFDKVMLFVDQNAKQQ